MALVGNTWLQSSDPTVGNTVLPCQEWFNTSTGDMWQRNTLGSAWVYKGNGTLAERGMMPVTGGAFTSPISGPFAGAPSASPDIRNSARKRGINLARKVDLDALKTEMENRLITTLGTTVNWSNMNSTLDQNSAWGQGFQSLSVGQLQPYQIPLPSFPDGAQATDSQVLAHAAWLMAVGDHASNTGGAQNHVYFTYLTQTGTARSYQINFAYGLSPSISATGNGSWPWIGSYNFGIGYMILAVR